MKDATADARLRARQIIDARRQSCCVNCLQNWEELAEVATLIEAVAPRLVVEIGACELGWLWMIAPFCPDARLIGIDPLAGRPERVDLAAGTVARLAEEGRSATFLHETSEAARAFVAEIVGGASAGIDVLHIDGAHDYRHVKQDWQDWRCLVRAGGLVLFHDAAGLPGPAGVFGEIVGAGRHQTRLISAGPGSPSCPGIGVVEISAAKGDMP